MLFSKNQSNCDSVAFFELRVAFHLHVELLQFPSSNFTKISLFHSRPIFFQMLRPMRKKSFLYHAKFISLSFELKFGIFFVVVMNPIKKAWTNYEFCTHYFCEAKQSPPRLFVSFSVISSLFESLFRDSKPSI